MKKHFLLFGLLIALFSACKKEDFSTAKQADIDDAKIKAYIAANHINVTKDASGIYYQIITANTGPHPTLSDTVQVTYSGRLLNGTVFDSGNVANFALTEVVKGWQIALPLIGSNGTAPYARIRFIVPSGLAYGNTSSDSVPANSVLDFTVDLIGIY